MAWGGDNSYKILHIKKNKLRKNGLLPESITCGRQLFEDGCARLSHEDMENVMDELAVQVADDLQMSDIFTALEALGIDDENECAM